MGKALFLALLLLIKPAFAQEKVPHDIICATVIVIAGSDPGSPQAEQLVNDIRETWRFRTGTPISSEALARVMLACVDRPSSTIGEVFATLAPPQPGRQLVQQIQ